MKHLPSISLALLLLTLPLASQAFQAPDDFRGMRWGTPLAEQRGLAALDDAVPIRYYQRANEPLILDGAALKNLFYGFYRDQFYSVLITFEGRANFDKARGHLLAAHGKADRSKGDTLQWGATNDFFIHLKYSDAARQGYAFYVNRKLAPLD